MWILKHLRTLPHAPGVQVQPIPEDAVNDTDHEEDMVNPDERLSQFALDKHITPDNEFSDSEEEGEGGRRDERSFKITKCFHVDEQLKLSVLEDEVMETSEEIKAEVNLESKGSSTDDLLL